MPPAGSSPSAPTRPLVPSVESWWTSITYGPGLCATTGLIVSWSWYCSAFGLSRMLPTTTMYLSKLTLQPSTNCGSPWLIGVHGRPFSPSVSPETVTSIESGVFGLDAVNPGLHEPSGLSPLPLVFRQRSSLPEPLPDPHAASMANKLILNELFLIISSSRKGVCQ